MKLEVIEFTFEHKKGSDYSESMSFNDPFEAIKYFTAKGYGMWHWNIYAELTFGIKAKISLETFNDLTDCWED